METYCLDYLKTEITSKYNVIFCRSVVFPRLQEFSGPFTTLARLFNRVMTLFVWIWKLILCRPDIVHVHTNSGYGLYARGFMVMLSKVIRSKTILHMHGASFKEYYQGLSKYHKIATLKMLRCPKVLIVLSKEWKTFFESIGVPPDMIIVCTNSVYLPIVSDKYKKSPKLSALFLSRIEGRKGIHELIDVICSNSCVREKYHFVVAGPKTHDFELIMSRVKDLEIESFVDMPGPLVGESKEMAYRMADVYILQSYAEGLPIGLLEAMSYGIACITTPVGGIPDLVSHLNNGILIPPGDVDALKDALMALSVDDEFRNRLGNQARITIEGRHSWQAGEMILCELYDKLLKS